MIQFGKFIAKHSKLIILICILLLIPSVYGISKTRINYDVVSYLPSSFETMKGQDILVDEFGLGAFSMVVVEDMQLKDVQKLEEKIENVEHIKDVLWYDDVMDLNVPVEMLPNDIRNALFQNNATMLVVLFNNTTSSDESMEAVQEIRSVVNKQAFVSGMSGVVTDIKDLSLSEMPIYVIIAALMSILVLSLTIDSFMVPPLFLISIGIAILYNLGSNIIFGEISYLTKALTAILQLGVTMDYSIFLLNSYEENKLRYPDDKIRAMGHAISNTFKSVVGSSITTIAGFAALCFMTFTLGRDIGLVMAKGVIMGVICCITLLPALIIQFDKIIDKTTHKSIIPSMDRISDFITKHYGIWLIIFFVLLIPALHGNNNVEVYYNIDQTLPSTLDSTIANKKLDEDFNMNSVYMILLNNELNANEKNQLLEQVKTVDGIKWSLGLNSLVGANIPDNMIPDNIKSMLKSGQYELLFVCSNYKVATDEVNNQIEDVNDIVKQYDKDAIVMGEAPLTKDLADITATDLKNVNIVSIAAIFVIILLIFKSISLPVILVSVIEFAIWINMGIPFYTHTTLPFVAGIVIGTIQLGATVDYAILMTTKYQKERLRGLNKKESIRIAHESSMKSILISGCSFFAATFGVGLYSKIDMISSICTLLSRGAIISTIVVICVLPAMFMIFDKVIVNTSLDFKRTKFISSNIALNNHIE